MPKIDLDAQRNYMALSAMRNPVLMETSPYRHLHLDEQALREIRDYCRDTGVFSHWLAKWFGE